jgi:hypothetical protein
MTVSTPLSYALVPPVVKKARETGRGRLAEDAADPILIGVPETTVQRGAARMFYQRYTVQLKPKKAGDPPLLREKLFVVGNVTQVNEKPGTPLSFNLAVSRGDDRDPIYVNRVAVRRDAPYLQAFREIRLGQQITCEINVTQSERVDADGKPYENYWLQVFEWGRRPAAKGKPENPAF